MLNLSWDCHFPIDGCIRIPRYEYQLAFLLKQLAIAECYGIEALIRLLKRTRRDEVRKREINEI